MGRAEPAYESPLNHCIFCVKQCVSGVLNFDKNHWITKALLPPITFWCSLCINVGVTWSPTDLNKPPPLQASRLRLLAVPCSFTHHREGAARRKRIVFIKLSLRSHKVYTNTLPFGISEFLMTVLDRLVAKFAYLCLTSDSKRRLVWSSVPRFCFEWSLLRQIRVPARHTFLSFTFPHLLLSSPFLICLMSFIHSLCLIKINQSSTK